MVIPQGKQLTVGSKGQPPGRTAAALQTKLSLQLICVHDPQESQVRAPPPTEAPAGHTGLIGSGAPDRKCSSKVEVQRVYHGFPELKT